MSESIKLETVYAFGCSGAATGQDFCLGNSRYSLDETNTNYDQRSNELLIVPIGNNMFMMENFDITRTKLLDFKKTPRQKIQSFSVSLDLSHLALCFTVGNSLPNDGLTRQTNDNLPSPPIIVFSMTDNITSFPIHNESKTDFVCSTFSPDGKYLLCVSKFPENMLSIFSLGAKSLIGHCRIEMSGQVSNISCLLSTSSPALPSAESKVKDDHAEFSVCISSDLSVIVLNIDSAELASRGALASSKGATEGSCQKQLPNFDSFIVLPTAEDNRKHLVRDHVWMPTTGSASETTSQRFPQSTRWSSNDSTNSKTRASDSTCNLLIVLSQTKALRARRQSMSQDIQPNRHELVESDSLSSKFDDQSVSSIDSKESKQPSRVASNDSFDCPQIAVFKQAQGHSTRRRDDESSTNSSHYCLDQEVSLPMLSAKSSSDQREASNESNMYNCIRRLSRDNREKDGFVVGGDRGSIVVCDWINGVLSVTRFCSLGKSISIRTIQLSSSSDFTKPDDFHVICCVQTAEGQKNLTSCKFDEILAYKSNENEFRKIKATENPVSSALDDISGWSTFSGSSLDIHSLVSVANARNRPIISSLWRGNTISPEGKMSSICSLRFWNLKTRKKECLWNQDGNFETVNGPFQVIDFHPSGYNVLASNQECIYAFNLLSETLMLTGKLAIPLRLRSVVSEQELSRKRRKHPKNQTAGADNDRIRAMISFSHSGDKFFYASSVCASTVLVCSTAPLSILHTLSSFSMSLNKLSSGHDGMMQADWDLCNVVWNHDGSSLISSFRNGAITFWTSLNASNFSIIVAENEEVTMSSSIGNVIIESNFLAYAMESFKGPESEQEENKREPIVKTQPKSPARIQRSNSVKSPEKKLSSNVEPSDHLVLGVDRNGTVAYQPCTSLAGSLSNQSNASGTDPVTRSRVYDNCLSTMSDCQISCWLLSEVGDLLILGTTIGTIRVYETRHLLKNVLAPQQDEVVAYFEHCVHQGPIISIQAFNPTNFIRTSTSDSSDAAMDARAKTETRELILLTTGKNDGSCAVMNIQRCQTSQVAEGRAIVGSSAVMIEAVDIVMMTSDDKLALKRETSTLSQKLIESNNHHNKSLEDLKQEFKQRENRLLSSLEKDKLDLHKQLENSVTQCEAKVGELLQQLDSRDIEHSRIIAELENRYESRMNSQLDRFDQTVEQSMLLKGQSDGYLQSQKLRHDKAISNQEKEARERERRIRQECGHIQDELHNKEITFKEVLSQQETEYENEIKDLIMAAENEIRYERQETAKIQTIVQTKNTKLDGLMKKFQEMKNSSQAKQTLLMHERNERKRLEDQVEHMKSNILERDSVISEKENELAAIRESSKTLDNFKIVLGHRLRELSEEKGPVSRRIEELEDHLRKMYDEMATNFDEKKDSERIMNQTSRRISSLTSESLKLRQQLQEQGVIVTALKREISSFISMARMLPATLTTSNDSNPTNDALKQLTRAILDCQKRFDYMSNDNKDSDDNGSKMNEAIASRSIARNSESGTNALVNSVVNSQPVDNATIAMEMNLTGGAIENKHSHKKLIPLSGSIPYTSQQVTCSSKQAVVVQVDEELVDGIKDAHRTKKMLLRSNADLAEKIKLVDKNTARVVRNRMKENAMLIQESNELRRENVSLRREMDRMQQEQKSAPTPVILLKPLAKKAPAKLLPEIADDNSELRPLSSTISSSGISVQSDIKDERCVRGKDKDDLKSEIVHLSMTTDNQDRTIQMQRNEISSLKNLIRAMSSGQFSSAVTDKSQTMSEEQSDTSRPVLTYTSLSLGRRLNNISETSRGKALRQIKRRTSEESFVSSASPLIAAKERQDDLESKLV